jgi:hypothetical protein
MTSATGHFCKVGLAGCGTKSDIGKTIKGHASSTAMITAVRADVVTLSAAASRARGAPVPTARRCHSASPVPPRPQRRATPRHRLDRQHLCSASAAPRRAT